MDTREVIMIGPSLTTKGGISIFERVCMEKLSGEMTVRHIATYTGANRLLDGVVFLRSIFLVFIQCVSDGRANRIFHIHLASNGSFFRKYILSRVIRATRNTYVIHLHGGLFDVFYERSGYSARRRIRSMFENAGFVIALSDSWRAFILRTLGISEGKVRVVSSPAETSGEECSERYERKSETRLLFAGALLQRKGLFDLLRAVADLKNEDISLSVIGTGDMRKLDAFLRELNVDRAKVRIHGWMEHDRLLRVLREHDVFVLPSYVEGLPMSILEAIGCGLPVIATNIGGIPEAVVDAYNGFLIEPGDIATLKEKILLLCRNGELRVRMGLNGKLLANERFSVRAMTRQLREIYDAVEENSRCR